MTTPQKIPGVHYGESFDEYTKSWDEAIDDAVWAIREGYIDKHLAVLVRAAIERRQHLAEHNAVPALAFATSAPAAVNPPLVNVETGVDVNGVQQYATGWDARMIDEALMADVASVRPTNMGVIIAGHHVNPRDLSRKVVRLQGTKNTAGAVARINATTRERANVVLLTRPNTTDSVTLNAFEHGKSIAVPFDALASLLAL